MKVKIDLSGNIPKIQGEYGTLEYSEKSNSLFIKSKRRGVIPIGSSSSVAETDPIFTNWLSSPPNISTFNNDSGYLTSFTETDPVYTASSWNSTTNNSSDWDTAFSWGDHASAGYLQNNVGISGGTSIIGGTSSGENLTLYSTSNATKGKIILGSSAYDEVNNRLGIGITTATTKIHVETNALGITQTESSGILLDNATAATNGAQQISPALELKGRGWKTAATAGSQTVAFRQYVLPEQNITNPTGALIFQSSVNGASYTTRMAITTGGNVGIGTISPTALLSITTLANSGTLLSLGANSQQGLFRVAYSGGATTLTSSEYGTFTIATNGGNQNINIMPNGTGKVGIGQGTPTAALHIKAGTAAANTAPIKLTSGTNLTTPENGALEYDGTNLYFTVGGVRKTIQLI